MPTLTLEQKSLRETPSTRVDTSPGSPGNASPCARLPAPPSPSGSSSLAAASQHSHRCAIQEISITNIPSGLRKAISTLLCGSHSSPAPMLLFPKRPPEPTKPHTSIKPRVQLQYPSLRWNWDQFLLILDVPWWSPLWKRFLVPLFPMSSPKDAQGSILGSPSWFFSLRHGSLNILGLARILCLPPHGAGIPWIPGVGRVPGWMLSPVVSNRAGRNEEKWDEEKTEISCSLPGRAEGLGEWKTLVHGWPRTQEQHNSTSFVLSALSQG